MAKKRNDIVEPMTIDNLSATVNGLSTTVNGLVTTVNDVAKTIDGLAIMMAKGFEEVKEDILGQIVPRLDILEHKMDAVRSDISTLFFDDKKLKSRVENLESNVFGSVQEA